MLCRYIGSDLLGNSCSELIDPLSISRVQLTRGRLQTAATECNCCWGAITECSPLSLASICWGSGDSLGAQAGQWGGRGPLHTTHCDREHRSRAGPSRREEAFSIEEPTRVLFSQPAFFPLSGLPSSLIQPCPLVLFFFCSLLADWYTSWNVLFLSFFVNWLFYYETSPTTPPFPSLFFGKLNRTMLPASQSSCGTSKSLVHGWEELPRPDKFFLFFYAQYSWPLLSHVPFSVLMTSLIKCLLNELCVNSKAMKMCIVLLFLYHERLLRITEMECEDYGSFGPTLVYPPPKKWRRGGLEQ